MYASTGDRNSRRVAITIVAELAKCQAASPKAGFHSGYLSAFPESFIDRVDRSQAGLGALVHAAQDHGRPAGDVRITAATSRPSMWRTRWATGSRPACDSLTDAANAGHARHRARRHERGAGRTSMPSPANRSTCAWPCGSITTSVFDPLAAGEDKLTGLHANTQIPKIIGAARQYELTGDARYRRTCSLFFWDTSCTTPVLRHRRQQRRRAFLPDQPALAGTSARTRARPATPTTCSSSRATSSCWEPPRRIRRLSTSAPSTTTSWPRRTRRRA